MSDFYDKNKCIDLIKGKLLSTKRPGLLPVITRQFYIDKHNLNRLYRSIEWLTKERSNITLVERIYRVYNDCYDDVYCTHCNKNKTTFDKFTTGFNKFCSTSCSTSFNTPSKFLTDESKLQRSNKISKFRKGMKLTDEWKAKLKVAANNDDVKNKKQLTCLHRYGVKNPGVLGAYSSRAAQEYIINLLSQRNIDLNRCMFKYGDNKEFWQMIYVPFLNKKRYFSYDLIVFSTVDAVIQKDLTKIDLVFEYNGPWHYKPLDIIGVEQLPATPYPGNKFTRLQQIELDRLKIEHIAKFSPKEILTYWERIKVLERITVDNSFKVIE